jgi:REP element-mobilizing transposase RayT
MFLNKFGAIVKNEWLKTTQLRKNVKLDEYIIMPNHFHGVIILEDINNQKDTARIIWKTNFWFSPKYYSFL